MRRHLANSRAFVRYSLIVAALLVLAGCSLQRGPIRTSLVDVTGESRSISVYTHWFSPFPVAVHRQATSIGGLLQMPDVGQQFQFSGGDDVTTAIGVAVVQSYRLIGESDTPGSACSPKESWSRVQDVRDALERVQTYALDATILAAEVQMLREQSAKGDDDLLKSALDKKSASLAAKERALESAKNDLRVAAKTPGIVIARWSASGSAGASGRFGSGVGAAASGSDARSGFVILGGLRVVTLVLGEDFWWLLNNLREHEKDHIESIGITTHLLQARDVAYLSDLSTTRSVTAAFDAVVRSGTGIDELKLAAYWSFVGQYSNSGNLGRITWKREPYCAVCSLDLPGLSTERDAMLQRYFGVHGEHADPASYQGWRSIAATVTHLRDVPFFICWKNHAAKYEAERTMHSSPSCPYCHDKGSAKVRGHQPSSGKTPTEP